MMETPGYMSPALPPPVEEAAGQKIEVASLEVEVALQVWVSPLEEDP